MEERKLCVTKISPQILPSTGIQFRWNSDSVRIFSWGKSWKDTLSLHHRNEILWFDNQRGTSLPPPLIIFPWLKISLKFNLSRILIQIYNFEKCNFSFSRFFRFLNERRADHPPEELKPEERINFLKAEE